MAEGNDFGLGLAMGMDSNKSGGWGDLGGIWGIILLAMILGWGNGGIGGGNMNGGGGFALNSLDNGIRGVQNGLCDGFYAMNTGMLNGFSNVQSQMAQCLNAVGTCAA